MPITVTAIAETIPPDHTGVGHDPQQREVRATADTYSDALDKLRADLPDGFRLCWVKTV